MVDKALLGSLLGFPEDVEIWDAQVDKRTAVGSIEFLVRSDKFKDLKPGVIIPFADPKISASYYPETGKTVIQWVWPSGFLEEPGDDGISGAGPGEEGRHLSDDEDGRSTSLR